MTRARLAAIFTGVYVILTHRILRIQQTPIMTAAKTSMSTRNSGQGAAFNICVHHRDDFALQESRWLGNLGPHEEALVLRGKEAGSIRSIPDLGLNRCTLAKPKVAAPKIQEERHARIGPSRIRQ